MNHMDDIAKRIDVEYRLKNKVSNRRIMYDGKECSISMVMPGHEFVPDSWAEYWKCLRENFNVCSSDKTYPALFQNINSYAYSTVLEIGYGKGYVGKKLIGKGKNYYGIDYVREDGLDIDRFKKIRRSGIPMSLRIKNYYDLIFSDNTFQNLPKDVRDDYFKQGLKYLSKDGVFAVSLFLMSEKNRNMFQLRDGKPVSYFYNVVFECEEEEDLKNRLLSFGYQDVVIFYPYGENFHYGNVYAFNNKDHKSWLEI